MKLKAIHRITALTLAFLMFFTSMGFSVDFHYCKGELKSFSIVGEASACHGTMISCPRHADMQIEDKSKDSNCCSNETIVVDDLNIDYNISPDIELTNLQVKIVACFVLTFKEFSHPTIVKSTFLKTHDLLPSRDIYVLLERFLI